MSYIKLHRKVADHWVFKDARYFQIWMYLLFTANWKPSKRVVDGRLTEIPRGDVLTSLATIADATGNSIKVVRQFLTLAEMDTMVVTQRARRATWLTICNYETYQGDDIPSGHSNGTQTALKGISKGNTLRREEGEEGKNTDATHPALSGTPLIALPLNDGSLHPVHQSDVDKYMTLYPNVDVMQQLRSMVGWLDSHPRKRKTKRGIRAFISGWLDREQNRNRNTHAPHRPTQPTHGERVGFDPEQAVDYRHQVRDSLARAAASVDRSAIGPPALPEVRASELRPPRTDDAGAPQDAVYRAP